MANQLNFLERERISQMYDAGASQAEIATELGRARSTVSRELQRNSVAGEYSAIGECRAAGAFVGAQVHHHPGPRSPSAGQDEPLDRESRCLDGGLDFLDGAHPRGYGTFTRIMGRYVRDEHLMPLEEAIRKATSLAAANVGIHDRGRISVGAYADLVLFDPSTIIDRATPAEPHLTSTGVRRVWVNGASVYEGEHTTEARPGRVLKRVLTPAAK